jgi:hypothetical protein
MNLKSKQIALYLPALVLTTAISLSQLGVFNTLASAPISGPISAPITSPVVTPTPSATPAPSDNSGNSGSSNGSSGSSDGSPVCNDTKPSLSPKLISAVSKKANQVTLTWTKAGNPVSYYLVTYGLSSSANQYGNPNVGGANTTSYTVAGLSGNVTYYFRVRAGNGCKPGDFSNVLAVKANGQSISTPAIGFKPAILSSHVGPVIHPVINDDKPVSVVTHQNSNNLLDRLVTFFGHIFH